MALTQVTSDVVDSSITKTVFMTQSAYASGAIAKCRKNK
jgi:hypothetical protein